MLQREMNRRMSGHMVDNKRWDDHRSRSCLAARAQYRLLLAPGDGRILDRHSRSRHTRSVPGGSAHQSCQPRQFCIAFCRSGARRRSPRRHDTGAGSTSTLQSSASAGPPRRRASSLALSAAFSSYVACGSSTSGYSSPAAPAPAAWRPTKSPAGRTVRIPRSHGDRHARIQPYHSSKKPRSRARAAGRP